MKEQIDHVAFESFLNVSLEEMSLKIIKPEWWAEKNSWRKMWWKWKDKLNQGHEVLLWGHICKSLKSE